MEDRWNALVPYPKQDMQGTATGPLNGLTLAVKDIVDVSGYPTGAGNPVVLAASGAKTRTAPLVQTLLDGGASFVGKANTDELAYSLIGDNMHFGMPVNPIDPNRISGGSSSGSAVAVAAGLADIGLGTDTSGSVRLPAAVNGIIGWRPGHGTLDIEGVRPLAPSFDVPGILTARFDHMAAVMEVLGVALSTAPPSAVLLVDDILEATSSDIAGKLPVQVARLGLPIRRLKRLTSFGLEKLAACFVTILQAEAWESNKALFQRHAGTIEPGIADRLRRGAALASAEIAHARSIRDAFCQEITDVFADGAVLALPTLAMDPPLRVAGSDCFASFRSACLRLLCLAGLAGYPQLAFPISVRGETFSFSLMGNLGSDRALLGMASRLGAPN